MSGGKRCQTVGYWYRMGLHFGICHGPVDALRAIRVGDREAWVGNITANTSIYINQPNLFGGEDREGGIVGALDVRMGGQAQTANIYLSIQQGSPQPAYRGIVGAVFKGGKIAANNPYPKPWAFLVRRTLAGWGTAIWYPAKAEITLPGGEKAMNPAHIVYECITNPVWGMGYNPGMIDAASFAAAADAFHAEGLGLCIQWSRQDSIERFIQIVADHAGAVIGQDRRTGLFVIRPIRGGYSVGSLPAFGPHDIIELAAYERTATAEAVNEITVTYLDLAAGGKKSAITVQNLAAIQSQGAVVAETRDYPGIPTAELAARIATRDLRAVSTPLARLRFIANRDAWSVMPGDVVRFTWPALGIADMPIRILAIDYGDLTHGAITIEAAEDVFGLDATSYVAQQNGLWSAPSTTALPPAHIESWEAAYYDLVQAFASSISDVDATACYLIAAAAKPAGLALRYDLLTRVGSAAYAKAGEGDWSPTGVLAAAIGPLDTSITLSGGSRLDAITPGAPGLLGNEIVRIVSIDAETGAMTIERGCVDTVPAAWPAGTRLWVWHGFGAWDATEYAPGETVSAKYVTVTTADRLLESSAPADLLTMTGRQHKPYPPGNVRLNGQPWPDVFACAAQLTWAHRDRLTQADQLIPHSAGSIGPEAGVTYTLRWRDEHGALRRTHTGVTATSQTWSEEATDCGRWQGKITISIESVRAGVASHQSVSITSERIGYGLNWGKHWGGASGLTCAGMSVAYAYGDSFVGTGSSGATWNPADKSPAITLSNGDLTAEETSPTYCGVRATASKSVGKWYWEIRIDLQPSASETLIGIALGASSLSGGATQECTVRGNGQLFATASGASVSGAWPGHSAGDVLMFALDLDGGKMWVGKNGAWIGSGNPTTGANPTFTLSTPHTWFPVYRSDNTTSSLTRITARFSPAHFSYAPPAGYSPL